ncbi:MAG: tetratricopeptide repeat protein [Chloroflexota bacterium]|nr:tetratricopeptide repeat protein [Chloroflexota bacterium]
MRRRRRKPRSTRPPDRDSNPVIPWLHGLAAMGDERWNEAVEALQHFLEMASKPEDRWTAYQNLGACYLALERYDEALAALDEVERYAPDDPDTLHSRGVTYACAGRILEAIAAFELFARRWPKQARQYKTKETIRQLRRARRGKIPAETYLVDHLQERVSHNLELGDFHLVERKARRMITADPDRPDGHFALGVACVEQGRHPEALEAFLSAHTRDPDYAPTLYNVGHTYLQLGKPEQAISWLERALHLEPKHLEVLHQLGAACERLGQRDEAVAWWRRALKVDPGYHLAQQRLHEVGQGPAPAEPPLPPTSRQLTTMTPIVKARMKQPEVYRNGGVTLTYDEFVGFVLEDTENPRNATIHAGGPFQVARITHDEDLLDLIGLVKLLLHMVNVENTRDVAVLVYYADRPVFSYQLRFDRRKQSEFDTHGQFVVTEMPRLFKLRMDSDLSTPYGDPMRGMLIYLNQHPQPGILVGTLGLADQ